MTMLDPSYHVQDGCHNCGHCRRTYSHSDDVWYPYCHLAQSQDREVSECGTCDLWEVIKEEN